MQAYTSHCHRLRSRHLAGDRAISQTLAHLKVWYEHITEQSVLLLGVMANPIEESVHVSGLRMQFELRIEVDS